jgi:very-short-patch-repair endonuclease
MPNELVEDWFRRQRGLITRAQALGAGLSASSVQRRVASGEWVRVHPVVFRHGVVRESWDQRCLAAVLWQSGGVVSHSSALRLWQLDDGMARDDSIEVTVTGSSRARDVSLVVHRARELDRRDITTHRGLPVTTPHRTLLDIGTSARPARFEWMIEQAIARRLTTHDELEELLGRVGGSGRAGTAALREVLDARRVGGAAAAESVLELRAWRLIRSSGLPPPVRQHEVVVDGVVWTLDFAWPDRLVGLETDGFGPHSGRSAFEKDRRKLRALSSVGYRVLPATWTDVTTGAEQLLEDLGRAVRGRV